MTPIFHPEAEHEFLEAIRQYNEINRERILEETYQKFAYLRFMRD